MKSWRELLRKSETMKKRAGSPKALRRYELEEQEWQALFDYGRRKAQVAGIRTEEDVERLIDLARKPSHHPHLAV